MMQTVVQPESLKDPRPRYSQGILTEGGRLLFIAGQTASDREGKVIGKRDPLRQVEQVFENVGAVLAAAGGSFEHLVATTTYLTDIAYRDAFNRVRGRYFSTTAPTNTLVVVQALAHEDFLVEIQAIAVLPDAR